MTKFIQITDTHIVAHDAPAYGKLHTQPFAQRAVSFLAGLRDRIGPIDAVVVTGDLTDSGSTGEYRLFNDLLRPLGLPLLLLPGNHDRREALREAMGEVMGEGCAMAGDPAAPINWLRDLGDFGLIGLDSSVASKSHGLLAPETLGFLRHALSRLGSRPAFVALHHPPIATGIAHIDAQRLTNPADLQRVLDSHSAPCRIVCGHVHRTVFGALGRHGVVIAPSTAHAVHLDQRADARAMFVMEPPGLMLHEWRGGFVSHHIAIGDFAGPHAFRDG